MGRGSDYKRKDIMDEAKRYICKTQNKMEKSNLRKGDKIIYRNGYKGTIVERQNTLMIKVDGFTTFYDELTNYNEKLIHRSNKDLDIVNVTRKMKTITKEIQTVIEQVEVKEGTFYFDIDKVSHKATISFNEDTIDYKLEILTYFYEQWGIKVKSDYVFLGDDLPYEVKLFIWEDKSVKTITEEYYNEVRNEILKRL